MTAEQLRRQRIAALTKANAVRSTNARTFERLKESRDMVKSLGAAAELLRHGDWEGPLGSLVAERFLIGGVYYMGRRMAQGILEESGLAANRRMSTTTVRQRHVMARVLDDRAVLLRYRRQYR